MGKYDSLLKYIDLLSSVNYGEWVIDTKNDGSIEHPIQMPYVNYSKIVDDFVREVHTCWDNSGLQDYLQILKVHNIEWNSESMNSANIDILSSDVILALLIAAVRAEKFCDGALLGFLKDGSINKWLTELNKKVSMVSQTPILLNDLLKIPDSEADNVKVRFNQYDGNDDPMDLYLQNPEIINSTWLFWRNKQRFFKTNQIAICLMKLTGDEWLLTTVKKVTKELNVTNGVNYLGEEIPEYRKYFGRVKVKFHRTSQTQGVFYNTVRDKLEILEILPNVFDGDEFPGYDKVCISFTQLNAIIEHKKASWKTALENQKAVYLITDKNNGKLYVGSATSDNGMLLARWSSYAYNGHGGNTELKKIVNQHGFDYIKKNFQFSILENYNAQIDDKVILLRESWWKKVLKSNNFGYNNN